MEFFHCTSDKFKDDILNNGLLVSKSKSADTINPSIFLSSVPRHAFGNTCFRVEIPDSWVEQTVNKWEYICNRDIPSECIEFYSYEEDE